MSRIQSIQPENAEGKTKELLDAVQKKMGMVPNLVKKFANSPAVLEAYLGFSGGLAKSSLSSKLREQIALTVSQINNCNYCLAAHSAVGKMLGLSKEELQDSRLAISQDSKTQAALKFAQQLVEKQGWASDQDLAQVREQGYGDREITEIVATVALITFTNYLNHVADTEIDFPPVENSSVAAA